MTQSAKKKTEKKVDHLIAEFKTDYPNLYNSIGWRYVRRLLMEMNFSSSNRRC